MTDFITRFVVWSGGCDSTLLLERWSRDASINHPLYAISVESDVIGATKIASERQAREKIKEKLKDRPIRYITVKQELSGDELLNVTSNGLNQPQFWLGAVLPFIPERSRIAFGYIKGDCFWDHRHAFERFFAGLAQMKGFYDVLFEFPLETTTKIEVIQELKDKGLYELVWYCENPSDVGKPCDGTCTPCKTHRYAVKEMKKAVKKNKFSKKKMKRRNKQQVDTLQTSKDNH